MNIITKLINHKKGKEGPMQLIKKYLVMLKNKVFSFRQEVLVCISENDPVFNVEPKISVKIRKAEASDIPQLNEIAKDYEKRDFLKWTRERYVFYVAQFEEKIVGYSCICPAKKFKYKIVSILNLNGADAWIEDAYIVPAYRGNRIYPGLSYTLITRSKELGFKRIYATIRSNNIDSRRAHKLVGIKEIGLVRHIRILRYGFIMIKRPKGCSKYYYG